MKTILFCAGAPDPYIDIIDDISPTFIVGVDGGVEQLQKNGITPDISIGDFDSISFPNINNVIKLPCEKDETDLQFSLKYVLNQYTPEEIDKIVVLGAINGGRLDHLLCNIWPIFDNTLKAYFHKLVFIEKNNTLKFFLPGAYILNKENNKKYLSFITMSTVPDLTLENVKYPLYQKSYTTPIALISNEFLNDKMNFSFSKGILAVIQSSD